MKAFSPLGRASRSSSRSSALYNGADGVSGGPSSSSQEMTEDPAGPSSSDEIQISSGAVGSSAPSEDRASSPSLSSSLKVDAEEYRPSYEELVSDVGDTEELESTRHEEKDSGDAVLMASDGTQGESTLTFGRVWNILSSFFLTRYPSYLHLSDYQLTLSLYFH